MTWWEDKTNEGTWKEACRKLAKSDITMRRMIKAVGPCTLAPRRDYFRMLCKAIYGQQVSTVVAATLFGRFCQLFPNLKPTPEEVRALLGPGGDETKIATCGLSRQKKKYLLDLAEHFIDGRIPARGLNKFTDDQIIEKLTQVNGIGRWTAEMFLIFVLNRPDVFPVDDLGLRVAVHKMYDLAERPGSDILHEHGERWKPYRSIATWYLWRYLTMQNEEEKAKKTISKK